MHATDTTVRFALLMTFILASAPTFADVDINHKEFLLKLAGDWVQRKTDDKDQFVVRSAKNNSQVTVSILMARFPSAKLKEVAQKFLQSRERAEHIDASRKVELVNKRVEPEREMYKVSYSGTDNRGRQFRFVGYVTTVKVLSFYCETLDRDALFGQNAFDEAFKGFKFYVP